MQRTKISDRKKFLITTSVFSVISLALVAFGIKTQQENEAREAKKEHLIYSANQEKINLLKDLNTISGYGCTITLRKFKSGSMDIRGKMGIPVLRGSSATPSIEEQNPIIDKLGNCFLKAHDYMQNEKDRDTISFELSGLERGTVRGSGSCDKRKDRSTYCQITTYDKIYKIL